MQEFFYEVLTEFVKRGGHTSGQLERISGVPKQTIVSWLDGRVKKPRSWQDILRLAVAMRLNEPEANRLLRAVSRPPVAELLRDAQKEQNKEIIELLAFWSTADHSPSAPATLTHSLANAPFQAPAKIKDLVGRTDLLKSLRKVLVSGGQVCLLRGMGGVGKTGISIQLAYELRDLFPDGVLWANLSNALINGQRDTSVLMGALGTFAQAYGRDVNAETTLADRSRVVREVLANKRVLVVLDNAESTEVVEPFLPPSTGLPSVLITTRNRRMLASQALAYDVEPFDQATSLEMLSEIIGADRVAEEQAGAEKIATLLGGLPLALRVVASDLVETTSLTLNEYYELLLDERTRLENLADWEDASKDIRASFAVSFKRLPPPLQGLYVSLAVFSGSDFSVAATAAVVNLPLVRVKKEMGRLRSLSLVELASAGWREDEDAHLTVALDDALFEDRYRLHALLKLFAAEKMADLGLDEATLQGRAARYFADLAERHGLSSFQQLDLDWHNVWGIMRVAARLEWVDELIQGVAGLTQINLGAVGFLDTRGYWEEASYLLRAEAALADFAVDKTAVAINCYKQGVFALRRADSELAERHFTAGLAQLDGLQETEAVVRHRAYLCEAMSEMLMKQDMVAAAEWSRRGVEMLTRLDSSAARPEMGYLYIRHASIIGRMGQFNDAIVALDKGLSLLPEAPTAARVSGLMTLGVIHNILGDAQSALEHWEAGVADAKAIGDNRRLAGLWSNLAIHKEHTGELLEYIAYVEQARDLYEQIGDTAELGRVCSNLGFVHTLYGEFERAKGYLDRAVAISESHQLPDLTLFVNINLARWHLAQGWLDEVAPYLEKARQLCEQMQFGRWLAEVYRLESRLLLSQEDAKHALISIKKSLASAGEHDHTIEQGRSWREKGNILFTLDDKIAAKEAYQKSLSFLDENRFEQARSQLAFGIYFLNQQQRKQAMPLLKAAQKVFAQLKMSNNLAATEKLIT